MEERDNELDESQESTLKYQNRNSAIDGIVAVIYYMVSLTNQEL